MKLSQKLIVIVGMTGAGKTLALKAFEDMGYFCIDRLPVDLLVPVVRTARANSGIQHAAVVVTPERSDQFNTLAIVLKKLIRKNRVKVIYMNASDQQLIARFKEHRKPQPWSPRRRVVNGIRRERDMNRMLSRLATVQIDTTHLRPAQLRRKLAMNFTPDRSSKFHIDVMSFGFKYGMPLDADIVMDVRFLPNPFYIPSLKHLNGTDSAVYNYVMKKPVTQEFCRRFLKLLQYSIPGYIKEGKPSLTIAIGCTGGQHRSVTVARKVASVLSRKYPVNLSHRDVTKSYQQNRFRNGD